MIIIGIVLSFVALAYFCWLLFALAVYALAFFVGAAVGLVTYHSGSGPIGAIIVGATASGVALVAGRLASSQAACARDRYSTRLILTAVGPGEPRGPLMA